MRNEGLSVGILHGATLTLITAAPVAEDCMEEVQAVFVGGFADTLPPTAVHRKEALLMSRV